MVLLEVSETSLKHRYLKVHSDRFENLPISLFSHKNDMTTISH